MTTYTIAIAKNSGALLATAADGDEEMMQTRLAETMSQFDPEEREALEVEYTSGLTLYATEEDAEEAEAEVFYTGTDMGWLQDAEGRMEYEAAGFA